MWNDAKTSTQQVWNPRPLTESFVPFRASQQYAYEKKKGHCLARMGSSGRVLYAVLQEQARQSSRNACGTLFLPHLSSGLANALPYLRPEIEVSSE